MYWPLRWPGICFRARKEPGSWLSGNSKRPGKLSSPVIGELGLLAGMPFCLPHYFLPGCLFILVLYHGTAAAGKSIAPYGAEIAIPVDKFTIHTCSSYVLCRHFLLVWDHVLGRRIHRAENPRRDRHPRFDYSNTGGRYDGNRFFYARGCHKSWAAHYPVRRPFNFQCISFSYSLYLLHCANLAESRPHRV